MPAIRPIAPTPPMTNSRAISPRKVTLITPFQIGTINTARHYRLRNFGAIAPRYWADFVVFDDLKNFQVRQTWKKGKLVAENGEYLAARPKPVPLPRSTMNLRYDAAKDFAVAAAPGKIRI